MIQFLQFLLIILIVFKLDSLNYYGDIQLNKVQKIEGNLDDVLNDFKHIIANKNYFFRDMLIKQMNDYHFITNNTKVTGTFLGSNKNLLFIASKVYLFEIDVKELITVYSSSSSNSSQNLSVSLSTSNNNKTIKEMTNEK